MTYDVNLANRVRTFLNGEEGISEHRMFGGISFMLHGDLMCGVLGKDLIVRVRPEMTEQALSKPDTRAFGFTGRPMRGWVVVEPTGFADDENLRGWIDRGCTFVRTLPSKKGV